MLKNQIGITLLELLIVLVVMAIVMGIAIPSYQTQVTKAKRSDGLVALLDLTTRLERYYAEHHTFIGAKITKLIANNKSPEGYYRLSLHNVSATKYLATATPLGMQKKADAKCGALSINEVGQKSIGGSGTVDQCWR